MFENFSGKNYHVTNFVKVSTERALIFLQKFLELYITPGKLRTRKLVFICLRDWTLQTGCREDFGMYVKLLEHARGYVLNMLKIWFSEFFLVFREKCNENFIAFETLCLPMEGICKIFGTPPVFSKFWASSGKPGKCFEELIDSKA